MPRPACRAGTTATVSGVKVGVPYAAAARWILVPASTTRGDAVVVVVEPDADGLSCQRTRSSSGLPEYTLRLDGQPHRRKCWTAARADDLYQLAVAGACAVADGALAAALDLTTEHVRTREQFGRPLATFQAVAQQIADVYAAARTLHLAAVSACWRLDAGLDAGRDVDVAAYWLAEHGPAALRTCHHLHGGLGMDVTYPLPRYSALMTDLAAFVGGAADRLDRLGAAGSGWCLMFLDLTDAQRTLRDELRAYFATLIAPAEREAMLTERHGTVYREIVRRMGRDGWLGVGWPVEYGGRGLGQIEQQIFVNEAALADVPLPAVTLQTVGPTLMAHGSQEQKDFFLPKILTGELHFAIGYTEPGAGTDLASLRTRAVLDGDQYIVNGQKIFTTGGHDADYIWLACRTDPDAPKHKGLSILIVDTSGSWLLVDADHHARRRASRERHLLRRRPRPGHDAGRRRERGLAADHRAAQPRAGDAGSRWPPRRAASAACMTGPRGRPGPTAARCSTSRTCAAPWPGPARPSGSTSCSTGRSP